jgi:hypothetical protein
MAHIIPTTSYIQKRARSSAQPDIAALARKVSVDESVAQHAWDLLGTPQTVKSLRRATAPANSPSDEEEERLVAYMHELLEHDLIEVSPDT